MLLQTVGVILFLSSCCVCSTSFLWDEHPSTLEVLHHAHERGLAASISDDPAKLGLMLTVMASTVGGLAMAVCGLGLQTERRGAAWGAMGAVTTLAAILIGAGVALWMGDSTLIARTWNIVLVLLVLLLDGFAWVALRQVIANPPPPGVDIIPPGTKIPYSFYHDDPPEVRLAQELAHRRAKLNAEQQEVERMEKELRDKKDD